MPIQTTNTTVDVVVSWDVDKFLLFVCLCFLWLFWLIWPVNQTCLTPHPQYTLIHTPQVTNIFCSILHILIKFIIKSYHSSMHFQALLFLLIRLSEGLVWRWYMWNHSRKPCYSMFFSLCFFTAIGIWNARLAHAPLNQLGHKCMFKWVW